MHYHGMKKITENLEINWNGKIKKINKTPMTEIIKGLWEGVEDLHWDELAKESELRFEVPIYRDDPSWYS